jgi:hypothetical protein
MVPVNLALSSTFANLQHLLDINVTELYVVSGSLDYNTIFKDSQSDLAGGLTSSVGVHIYSSPWESGSIGQQKDPPTSYSSAMYKEVAAHELGHAVDISFGHVSQVPLYSAYLQRDVFDLNYVLDTTVVPNAYIKRLPCAQTKFSNGTLSTDTAPFAGVADLVDSGYSDGL